MFKSSTVENLPSFMSYTLVREITLNPMKKGATEGEDETSC